MGSDTATFQLLQNALAAANLRQQVYANNIANAQTPGYKRQDVEFESLLSQAMTTPVAQIGEKYIPINTGQTTDWSQLAQIQPTVVTDSQSVTENNGNNVDIDAEMADLAENQIRYNALIQDVQMRLSRMQTAINGG